MTETWFTGSNGNLFCDAGAFRYCIALHTSSVRPPAYSVARDGIEFARVGSLADARRVVWLENFSNSQVTLGCTNTP